MEGGDSGILRHGCQELFEKYNSIKAAGGYDDDGDHRDFVARSGDSLQELPTCDDAIYHPRVNKRPAYILDAQS